MTLVSAPIQPTSINTDETQQSTTQLSSTTHQPQTVLSNHHPNNSDMGVAMTTEKGLFGDNLVAPHVAAALPEGYRVRALRRSDYNTGYLDCLRVLTTVGEITEAQFQDRYDWLSRQDGSYYILVIEDASGTKVVGTGALIVERKL